MRCIEMQRKKEQRQSLRKINSNMRCIEIVIEEENIKKYIDKQ